MARKQTIVVAAKQEEVQTRRGALALMAGLVSGLVAVESAQANQAAAKNSSVASMSAYNLEGGIKVRKLPALFSLIPTGTCLLL